MCEYKPGTAVPFVRLGSAAANGSHFLIMCSNSLAFLVVFAGNEVCLDYSGHSVYKLFHLRFFHLI